MNPPSGCDGMIGAAEAEAKLRDVDIFTTVVAAATAIF